MDNNRVALRQRVLKAGKIEFGGGAIDCTLRNVSETGAALDVVSPIGIPNDFNLIVPADSSRRYCRVVWRTDKRIGVRFEKQADGAP